MRAKCKICGKSEPMVETTIAAGLYDWRLAFAGDPRWKKKIYIWEHGSCENDGRWFWDGESSPPEGWEIEGR